MAGQSFKAYLYPSTNPQMVCASLEHQIFSQLEQAKSQSHPTDTQEIPFQDGPGHLRILSLGLSRWQKNRNSENFKRYVGNKTNNNKDKLSIQIRRRDKLMPLKTHQGVKPKLETQPLQPKGSNRNQLQPKTGNNQGKNTDKGRSAGEVKKSSPTQSLVCGQCLRQYKNIRSYRAHMYQVHYKKIPEGSSHKLISEPFARAVLLKPNPSTKSDQPKQPRQDSFQQLSSGPSQRDSEMIEEIPLGNIVHGRRSNISQPIPLPIPTKGKKKCEK